MTALSRLTRIRCSRRRLLTGALGASGLLWLAGCNPVSDDESSPPANPSPTLVVDSVEGYTDPTRWAGKSITITSLGDEGGEYRQSQMSAIVEPFQRLTGAEVNVERTDLDALRAQVNAADVNWSVCDVPAEEVIPLSNAGTVQEIDYDKVDITHLRSGLQFDHAVGGSLIATVLSYRTDVWDNRAPSSWDDFWDLETFPGFRAMQDNPVGTLEFALLADGVPVTELYPIDVDRAFESLNRVEGWVVLWWRQGAQATQMIAAGDVALAAAWHNRIFELQQQGAPVAIEWAKGALNGQCWVVPSGAPNADVAMDFINFATRPEVSAAFSMLYPFGPVNRKAFELIPEGVAQHLPGAPVHGSQEFMIDFEWWAQNREAVSERFTEWVESLPPVGEPRNHP